MIIVGTSMDYYGGLSEIGAHGREMVMTAPLMHISAKEDSTELLWAEIHRLRAELKGPEGFDSWKDAAIAERVLRVKNQSLVTSQPPRPEGRSLEE